MLSIPCITLGLLTIIVTAVYGSPVLEREQRARRYGSLERKPLSRERLDELENCPRYPAGDWTESARRVRRSRETPYKQSEESTNTKSVSEDFGSESILGSTGYSIGDFDKVRQSKQPEYYADNIKALFCDDKGKKSALKKT